MTQIGQSDCHKRAILALVYSRLPHKLKHFNCILNLYDVLPRKPISNELIDTSGLTNLDVSENRGEHCFYSPE